MSTGLFTIYPPSHLLQLNGSKDGVVIILSLVSALTCLVARTSVSLERSCTWQNSFSKSALIC